MTKKTLSVPVLLLISFVSHAYAGANEASPTIVPISIRSLDYTSIPTDANVHHRTKWSNGVFIFIDDDAAAPSLYVFDRSGRISFSGMIQIPHADRLRVADFAAAPDGSVWAGGNVISTSGQRSFFLAHIRADGKDNQIIQTTPYRPCQVAVAPDGSVWTVGYGITGDATGKTIADQSQNMLRHFDTFGKLIAAGFPASIYGLGRTVGGFLVASEDRLGWYSQANGVGAYVEFFPNMKVLNTYPQAPTTNKRSITQGFALTPSGHVFVAISHSREDGHPPALYELDRNTNDWNLVNAPRDAQGHIPSLEGSDGESLVFTAAPDKSKLQVFSVYEAVAP